MSRSVSTGNTHEGFFAEYGICQVVIKTDTDAFHGFQIRCIEHIASHLKGINLFACREGVGIVSHGVALVVVADSVAEINGVGCIGFQRILQFHNNSLTGSLYLGHL